MKIKVVDSMMGSGKSQYAIQHMNNAEEENFIYITPYLDEVNRIKENCKNRKFIEPKECREKNIYSKSKSLKELIKEGKDIATTHSLFKLIDEETEKLLEVSSYTLILDEVMDVVQQIPMSKADLKMLFEDTDILSLDENNMIVLNKGAEEYLKNKGGKFTEFIHMAKLKRLFLFEGIVILWEFPVDVFRYFKEVYILTYLFDGQIQKYFFDFYDVEYEKFTVIKSDDKYKLVEYNPELDIERIQNIRNKINIYDGKLNSIGKIKTSLSVSWFERCSLDIKEVLEKSIYNWFNNINKVSSSESLWTCFKEANINIKNYKKAFVPHNLRATNEYSNTHALAYCVNRYVSPMLLRYFKSKNIEVNQDVYALSEMIQWIWRSRIRNGENISIYIPSCRMRELLLKFLGKMIP